MKDADVIVSQAHQIAILRQKYEECVVLVAEREQRLKEAVALLKAHTADDIQLGATMKALQVKVKKLTRANERLKDKVAPTDRKRKSRQSNGSGLEESQKEVSARHDVTRSAVADLPVTIRGSEQVAGKGSAKK